MAQPHGAWKRLILVGLAVAAVGAAAGGLYWAAEGKPEVAYVAEPIGHGTVARSVTATGTVNPVLTIIVGSYVSGVIQQLFCDYNTKVTQGQICAKIDPRPFQATLDQYSGQLARDQAILSKDRKDLQRYQSLAADNAIARQQADDQAFAVQQDEGTVQIDQALVESAKLNLDYTNIVSPVDGTIVSRNVTMGQTVASSFQTPTLFLIATDLATMQVDTNVSESDVGGIKEGNEATFTVDAFPKRTFQGRVSQIRQSPQTVQNVVTYDIVVSVDNTDLALMPGMTAATRIVVDTREDVVRVPNQALRFRPSGSSVTALPPVAEGHGRLWVLRQGQPVAVEVAVGLDDDNFTEILNPDFQPGDRVITGEKTGASGSSTSPRFGL